MSLRRRLAWPRFLPLLLAVVLVAVQTGGILHALGHLSAERRGDSPALPQHAVCALCVAYLGHEGAPVPAAPAVAALATVAPAPQALPAHLHLPPLNIPYQVRAPPAAGGA